MKHYLSKFQDVVTSQWEQKALCNFHGESFTFADVATYIEKFHLFFEAIGIRKDEKVVLCAKNSARWAISFLAANTYEAVVVPLLSDFLPESINHLVDHADGVVLMTDADIWKKLDIAQMPKVRVVMNVKDFTILYAAEDAIRNAYDSLSETFAARYPMGFSRENVSYPTGNDSRIAVINYTSGTTSAPKGVMLRYECFSASVGYGQKRVPAFPGDNVVSMLPMGHIYGLAFEFLYPLCSGVTVYYFGKTPSPTLLLKAMQEVRPYMVVSVPLVMEKVYKSSIKPALSKWYMKVLTFIPGINTLIYRKIGKKLQDAFGGRVREFIMGGAALNPEVEKCFKRIRLPYTVGYGMTEAAPLLAYESHDSYIPGSCGKPVETAEVRIDSEDPLHIAGEIQARGTNICSGYYKNPDADAMAFTADGFLHTGDLGIIDKNGNIYIKGRSKNMILSANGQNIYPEEIEAILNGKDFVNESVVVDRSGKLVALIYLDQDGMKKAGLDEEAISDIPENIRLNANRSLPPYSQIAKVEVMLTPFEKTPKMSIKRFLYS